MIKKALGCGVLLLIILCVGLYFGFSAILSKGLESGVETLGPKLTRTSIKLEDVRLSLLSGNGVVEGLEIGSPEGYKADKTFSCEKIEIQIAPMSLLSDHIVIDKIHIIGPEIVFEKKFTGNNLSAILKSVEETTAEHLPIGEEEDEESATKLEIGEFLLEDGSVSLVVAGKSLNVPLADLRMNDLGTAEGGLAPAELAAQIIKEVVKEVLAVTGKAAQQLAGSSASSLGKALQGGGDAAGDIGSKAAKAAEGLKGIFSKKKNE